MSLKDKQALRVAYFSPLPPARSGIADYTLDLLPYLTKRVQIVLFHENPEAVAHQVQDEFELLPVASFPLERRNYDLALYQMGNSTHHEAIYRTALRFPGVVVLHDYGLHHFIATITGTDQKYSGYVRDMAYASGKDGVELAWQVRYRQKDYPFYDLPLNDRLVDRSLGLIVHSQAAAKKINDRRPDRMVQVIPQPMPIMPARSRRAELDIADNTIIFASMGQITRVKQIDLALRTFARLLETHPNAAYLLVGSVHEEVDLTEIIHDLDIQNQVYIQGFATELQDFVDWIETADVIVNLRYPTVGETSASSLRSLAGGRPTIVFDIDAYSELPDEVCLKVRPMDEEQLLRAMTQLAEDEGYRRELGGRGRAYIERYHKPEQVAEQYDDFLQALLAEIDGRFGGTC